MDWVGRVIDGRYVVDGVVGSGGMGVVLSARHKFTDARVALKMVRKDLGLDPGIEARFLAEARVPVAIDHRGVVKTLDAGKTPEGELYLVMDLLVGRSLRQEIQAGSVPLVATRRIGMELLDVLAAAHARGVIHRDIKPENVFLVDPGAQVKLLDFGITKLLTGAQSVLPRTQAGVVLGTVAYMAPEQLADARAVDARADLWAVGIVLYELIAGRRPYRGTTIEDLLRALVAGEPDPIRSAYPQAPPDLEAFFARALAKDPQQRFASAGEMAQAFARLTLWPPASTPSVGVPGLALAGTVATSGPLPMYGRVKPPTAQTPAFTPLPPVTPFPGTPVPGTPVPTTPAAGAPGTSQTAAIRSGHPWLLLVAGAFAVVAGAGVVFFLMKRAPSKSDAPPPAAPQVAVAPPVDAAIAAPPQPMQPVGSASAPIKPAKHVGSTGPAPIDPYAGVATHPTPTPVAPHSTPTATPPPAPPPAADFCDASCKMLASCHLGSRSCDGDCARNPAIHQCLVNANGDCNAFAACMFAGYCSHIPIGTHSCSEAMDCESRCGGDQVCVCTCIQGLAPNRAAALLGLRGCAAPCRGDTACIAKTCDAQINRCRAQ
jgi:serine/threonine protein kinase